MPTGTSSRRAPSGPHHDPGHKTMNTSPADARQRALLAGEPRYWSNQPCGHGHIGWHLTFSRHCIECKNASDRRNYHKRKTSVESVVKRQAATRDWLRRHPEKRVQYNRNRRDALKLQRDPVNLYFAAKLYCMQGFACSDCRRSFDERNHAILTYYVPIEAGGKHALDNLRLTCSLCNKEAETRAFVEAFRADEAAHG